MRDDAKATKPLFDDAAFDQIDNYPGVTRVHEPSGISCRVFFNRNTGLFLTVEGGALGDRGMTLSCDAEHVNEVVEIFAAGVMARSRGPSPGDAM